MNLWVKIRFREVSVDLFIQLSAEIQIIYKKSWIIKLYKKRDVALICLKSVCLCHPLILLATIQSSVQYPGKE